MKIRFVLALSILLSIYACKDKIARPDVSNTKVNLEIVRYEKELFSIDPQNFDMGFATLNQKYPNFTKQYFFKIFPIFEDSTIVVSEVKKMVTHYGMKKLYDTVSVVNKNFNKTQSQIEEVYKNCKYYFPTYTLPKIYTGISEFSIQSALLEEGKGDALYLGLDMFLGGDFPYKNIDPTNVAFSDYLTRTYTIDHIPSKVAELLAMNQVPDPKGSKMIDLMIDRGKKWYIKKLLSQPLNDTLIYEYTEAQINWLNENELQIWSFFNDQNLIFESSGLKINKYLNRGPSSPGMPPQAPGNTASYLGMRIVESFVKNNPNVSLEKMLSQIDGQLFYNQSKYKPKR